MNEATISINIAANLIKVAAYYGANVKTLCHSSGVNIAHLSNRNLHLPLSQYQKLIKHAKQLTGRQDIALLLGQLNKLVEPTIIDLIMEASLNMKEAFTQLQRYTHLIVNDANNITAPRFELEQVSGDLYLVDKSNNINQVIELIETSFAKLTCGPRQFLPEPHILSAHFMHPAPRYAAAYDDIFQCPVNFNSHWNALQLAPQIANWQVAQHPHYIFSILTQRADILLNISNADNSITSQLAASLLPILHHGNINSQQISQEMGLSRTTLYRKLKSEGTSYTKTLDALRHQLATQYLKGQKTSVNEVAYLVGFSEPAAFSRAFKRWTGKNPQEFKEK